MFWKKHLLECLFFLNFSFQEVIALVKPFCEYLPLRLIVHLSHDRQFFAWQRWGHSSYTRIHNDNNLIVKFNQKLSFPLQIEDMSLWQTRRKIHVSLRLTTRSRHLNETFLQELFAIKLWSLSSPISALWTSTDKKFLIATIEFYWFKSCNKKKTRLEHKFIALSLRETWLWNEYL